MRTVTVFGATGAQGGSVVHALSCDQSYHVRAVTRNPRAHTSETLRQLTNIEIVEADLNDEESVRAALAGADACFLNTVTYFRESGLYNEEIEQGKRVADLCKELGVKQVVYSTIDPEWKQPTGIAVCELDNKIEVFSYMVSIDLPVVGVMMGFYYENILDVFRPSKLDQDTYGFGLPLGDAHWYLSSVNDLGPVVHNIFTLWADEYVGEIVPVIQESLTLQQMCDIINRHSQPITFMDLKITEEKFRKLTEENVRQEDIIKLFQVVCKAQAKPINDQMDCHKFHLHMKSFEEWVKANKHLIVDNLGT